eukprot:1671948-Pleurochrysis_carterae.AAC.2
MRGTLKKADSQTIGTPRTLNCDPSAESSDWRRSKLRSRRITGAAFSVTKEGSVGGLLLLLLRSPLASEPVPLPRPSDGRAFVCLRQKAFMPRSHGAASWAASGQIDATVHSYHTLRQ